MPPVTATSVTRQIESLFEGGSVAGLSDRHLVERFVSGRDAVAETAFAALVVRHGPMVLAISRAILRDRDEADDAFQAVFLVLARKARSIGDADLLANWLYGVTMRTARKARTRLARRCKHEKAAVMRRLRSDSGVPIVVSPPEETVLASEQAEALYSEVERLPGPFRLPIVLCYFEGLTIDEAAHRLRCPAGTIRSRLARACDKLRPHLVRRGFALAAGATASALSSRSASASVSPSLCEMTTQAAAKFAAGQTATGATSAAAVTLAREVLRSLLIHRLKLVAAAFLFLGSVASGAGFIGKASGRQTGKPDLPIAAKADDAEGKPGPGRMFVVGRVLDPQGKPVANAVIMVYAALQPPWHRTYAGWKPEPIGTARSGAHGRFQADAPRTSSARHHLVGAVASAPGYGSGWVDLEAGSERSEVDITLRSEQVIKGRLFDVNGRPVQGVVIRVATMGRFIPASLAAHRLEAIDGPSVHSQSGNGLPAWPAPALSDADGRFTIRGVGQDLRVILAIEDPRFARQEYPVDTTRALVSEPVKLALEPAQIIKGRVTDASTGKPIAHAALVINSRREDRNVISEFETDEEGRYRANPRTASRFEVLATAPDGRPNLGLSTKFDWPKGAIDYSVDLALPRGALIHGRVVEEKSGKPVAGARIYFAGRRADIATILGERGIAESDSDGAFQLTAWLGPGFLTVLGPTDDYVLRAEDGDRLIADGTTGHRRYYAHAFIPCHPKTAGDRVEVQVGLRRGVSVSGQVVGPDHQPIRDAVMISHLFLQPLPKAALMWSAHNHGSVKNGGFDLRGLDPDAETAVYFFDPVHELGATVNFPGKSPAEGAVVVELQHCGSARARLVNREGKPVADYRGSSLLAMVVTPGTYPYHRRPGDTSIGANVATVNGIDPVHYVDGPMSDSLGRITFPALIPGATYRRTPRNMQEASSNTEFTVRSGETVNLGDIVIEERRR